MQVLGKSLGGVELLGTSLIFSMDVLQNDQQDLSAKVKAVLDWELRDSSFVVEFLNDLLHLVAHEPS